MLELISENKEWVFSGIGVPAVSVLTIWMWRQLFASTETGKILPPLDRTAPKEEIPRKPTESEAIAERFQQVLKLFNEERRYEPFTIARLAQIMKLHKVSDLENITIGKQEPTFTFIEEFCETFGLNKEWLIEGKGSAFRSDRDENPLSNIENTDQLKVDRVYFIRSNSEIGEMFILLKYSDWKYRILPREIHVSDHVGAGGQLQLVDLYRLINRLKRAGVRCGGRTLNKELFYELLSGNIFPGKVINLPMSEDPWWDDFTDVEHTLPIAENYKQWHGESFIKAQEIVKWRLKH